LISGAENGLIVGRVNPIFKEGSQSLPLIEASTARQLGLRDGQIVQVLVQARGDQLTLLLRGRLIDMPPGQDWKTGQFISLRVQAAPSGPWILQPLATPPQPSSAPLELAAQATFSRVSNLFFKPPGMLEMMALFRPGVLDTMLSKLPRPDLQIQWNAMKLSMAKITPASLKQTFVSALGSEAGMVSGRLPPIEDPKQLLHKLLLELARPSHDSKEDKTTTQQIKLALDDLESAQVHAAQSQDQQEMMFTFVIPFHDADPVEISFQSKPNSDLSPSVLTINVHSISRDFGELWLKTELRGKRDVDLMMWALQDGIVDSARLRSSELGRELQEAGLSMHSFQVIHGARPTTPANGAPTGRGNVLDMRA
jgi:hypothetical protein